MSQIGKILLKFQIFNKNQKYLVCFSGGQDSINLFFLLANTRKRTQSIWCHHLWKKQDFSRLRHLFQMNFLLNQRFFYTIFFKKKFQEQTARKIRYQSFLRIAQYSDCDFIMTGHTQTDKIETFFLNFFRGAGSPGLTSLRETQIFLLYEYSKKFPCDDRWRSME